MKLFLFKLTLIILCLTNTTLLQGVYIQIFQTTVNGGITATGNTLGLSNILGTNQPGTNDGIGAFITQDTSSRVNNYPFGTTLDYEENGSLAFLDLPPGSVVLHAELIWSGSYGQGTNITIPLINSTSVEFVTPDGTSHSIAPKAVYPNGTGQTVPPEYYVRTQDVTTLVAAFFASNPTSTYSRPYITGNVPATIAASIDDNVAGWTLLVAFENESMNTHQLTLYGAFENNNAPPLALTGFQTPTSGLLSGSLFITTLEGDARASGDQMRVGPGTNNPPTGVLSGPNNPANNFFSSQINTLLTYTTDVNTGKLVQSPSGLLDTRGSFGTVNHNAFAGQNVTGGRQGWDIAKVDISSQLVNNQTQLFTQGVSSSEGFFICGLGLQIQQNAPLIVATKTASPINVMPSDTVTFTMEFENVGQESAINLTFFDVLPSGLTFDSGTFNLSVNGAPPVNIPITAGDLTTGVDLSQLVPSLDVTDIITITFDVTVSTFSPSYDNAAQLNYEPLTQALNLTAQTNIVTLISSLNAPTANPESYTTVVNTPLTISAPGVLTNDTGTSLTAMPINNFPTTLGGQVSIFVDGSFTYTPPTNYSGSGGGADTFDYTAVQVDLQTATSTVTVTITPQAVSDFGSVAANTTLNSLASILSNDLGSTPFQLVNYTQPVVAGSSVTVDPAGNYIYNPENRFSGLDSFGYTMADFFSQQSLGTVTINVLPAAVDDVGTTPANTTLNGASVFANDPSLGTLTGFQNPSAQGGTVTMIATGPNAGTYTYIPPLNFSGLDTFTYTISDGVNPPVTSTVRITVTPIAQPDTATTFVNTPLNQTTPVLNNDIGTGLFVASTGTIATVQNGTVAMNANGTYTYLPPLNSTGDDSFNYTLEDQAGSQSIAEVIIKLLPVLNNDFEMTFINTLLIGSSVLANDTNPNELIIVANQMQSDAGGMATMNVDGTFCYTPPPNFIGTDRFSYTAQDPNGDQSTAFVSINVIPRPVPPPPENFFGCIEKYEFLNKNEYRLSTTWTAPNSPTINISAYRIYRNGQLAQTIPAGPTLIFERFSSSRKSLSGYEIASVSDFGVESPRVKLEIIKK
ncbi:Ig-like domain-containing protein [Simkania sp.]|uniref:Ig-like domain-containing protein n=1 Tax=Simkania sp. TaxID=34094 RepID=UPI003B52D0C4